MEVGEGVMFNIHQMYEVVVVISDKGFCAVQCSFIDSERKLLFKGRIEK